DLENGQEVAPEVARLGGHRRGRREVTDPTAPFDGDEDLLAHLALEVASVVGPLRLLRAELESRFLEAEAQGPAVGILRVDGDVELTPDVNAKVDRRNGRLA